jgi:hypothetical protein
VSNEPMTLSNEQRTLIDVQQIMSVACFVVF